MACPVNMLVREDGEIRLAPRHGGGAGEEALVRHVDGVGRGPVVGLLSAMHDPGAGGGEEAVGVEDALDGAERLGLRRWRVALHLRAVEDPGRARHAALAVILGIVRIGIGVVLLVEDDEARPSRPSSPARRAAAIACTWPRAARHSRPSRPQPRAR